MTAPAVGHGDDEPLPEAVARWIAADPEYGAELSAMADSDRTGLDRLFDGRIAFGTAGLRAEMGPGPRRMNRLVVQQTTAGLMDWLPPGAKVVIGYDARHNSRRYASDVADVVVAKGGKAELIDRPAPTPILALAVLDRSADAGVMITASHNPAADNGYKLYLDDGIQLVSPADAEIAAAIDRVAIDGARPGALASVGDPAGRRRTAGRHLGRGHRTAPCGVGCHAVHQTADVAVLYTAMHGVGGEHLLACFEAAGFRGRRWWRSSSGPIPTSRPHRSRTPRSRGRSTWRTPRSIGSGPTGSSTVGRHHPGQRSRCRPAGGRGCRRCRHLASAQRRRGRGAADRSCVEAPAVIAIEDGGRRRRRLGGRDRLRRRETVHGTPLLASSIVSSRFVDRLAEAAGAGASEPSPGSSGSPGRSWNGRTTPTCWATRRRSATASATGFGTRTASPRPWS